MESNAPGDVVILYGQFKGTAATYGRLPRSTFDAWKRAGFEPLDVFNAGMAELSADSADELRANATSVLLSMGQPPVVWPFSKHERRAMRQGVYPPGMLISRLQAGPPDLN